MRDDEMEQNAEGTTDISDLEMASYDDQAYATSSDSGDTSNASPRQEVTADEDSANVVRQADSSNADEYDEAAFLNADENSIAQEFKTMTNVVDGKKRKPIKKKKRMSKRAKMIEYIAISCICVTFLSLLAVVGVKFLFAEQPTQGMDGAELIVDMTDCPYYFGTEGTIDLTKMFPGATDFAFGPDEEVNSSLKGNILTVSAEDDKGEDVAEPDFKLHFKMPASSSGEGGIGGGIGGGTPQLEEKIVDIHVVIGGVNVATWDEFRAAAADKQIITLQDNVQSNVLVGLKRKDYPTIVIRNDVYGNGKTINVFEIVVTRLKSGKKYGEPVLRGNGKEYGETGIKIMNKDNWEENGPTLFQDVHVTGNDMSSEAAVEGDGKNKGKPAGNLYGLDDATKQARGVLLFSRYATVVDVAGEDVVDGVKVKSHAKIKHCVIENGAKVLHIRNAEVDIEGTVIRNAADTAISIATYANDGSIIRSKNNVIANSLTGGVLFYCFDGSITEGNAKETWNNFYVDGFLDIYNWKQQNGLAFLPETEDFASIANPIAASEIPKEQYNKLKGQDAEGNMYIHFAIIKIRTGGTEVKRNDSMVHGADKIGFKTAREIGFTNGFPIPGIASAIMNDIDVWGYYGNDTDAVKPTDKLGGETPEDLAFFYRELREGRLPESERPVKPEK